VVILPPPAREALHVIVPRVDVPCLFVTRSGRRFAKSSLLYYWNPVRAVFGRPGMDFYELRHFCATHLLKLGVVHADVAVQLGHTDGGALVMTTYGHTSEDGARQWAEPPFSATVTPLSVREARSQMGGSGAVALALLVEGSRESNPPPPFFRKRSKGRLQSVVNLPGCTADRGRGHRDGRMLIRGRVLRRSTAEGPGSWNGAWTLGV
jgi:hypothetical protein